MLAWSLRLLARPVAPATNRAHGADYLDAAGFWQPAEMDGYGETYNYNNSSRLYRQTAAKKFAGANSSRRRRDMRGVMAKIQAHTKSLGHSARYRPSLVDTTTRKWERRVDSRRPISFGQHEIVQIDALQIHAVFEAIYRRAFSGAWQAVYRNE
jgi:hypothetical protein